MSNVNQMFGHVMALFIYREVGNHHYLPTLLFSREGVPCTSGPSPSLDWLQPLHTVGEAPAGASRAQGTRAQECRPESVT